MGGVVGEAGVTCVTAAVSITRRRSVIRFGYCVPGSLLKNVV